jgi:HEAT repeat protein
MKLRSVSTAGLLTALTVLVLAAEPPKKVEDKDRIPELKEKALNGLTQERTKAISTLGSISDERRLSQFGVPDFLLNILKDGNNNSMVREAAADALARIIRYVPAFTAKALRPLVSRLQDSKNESLNVRRKIAAAMAGFLEPESVGHRSAFQALMSIARARKDEPGLTAEVLRTLGKTGYSRAMTVIIAALRDKDDQVRAAALEALESVLSQVTLQRANANEVVTQLVAILSSDNVPEEIRIKAMEALVATLRAGVEVSRVAGPLVDALGKACDKKQPDLAAAVVKALHRVPDKNSVVALKKAYGAFLNNPGAKGYEDVRVAIAYTLGEYFHPLAKKGDTVTAGEVAKALLEISQKEPPNSSRAVKAAVFSMGLMDSKKLDRTAVVADLIDAMARDKAVTADTRQSLVRIIGVDLGEDVKKWEEWFKKNKDQLAPRR